MLDARGWAPGDWLPNGVMEAAVDGGKTIVTLELDAALVEAAAKLGPDLASTIERALRRQVPRPMTEAERSAYVEMAKTHYEQYGLPGEDYLPV